MKKLLIMRHANSSWDHGDLSDFERPLNPFGFQTAQSMGNLIYKNGLVPNIIISSPAKRAKQTAVLTKASAGIGAEVEYVEKLYEASPTALLAVSHGIKEMHNAVLLVGHCPGIENFVRFLTGETIATIAGSIAIIDLNIEMWSQIDENCGNLDRLLNPENVLENTMPLETNVIY
jgi:phosphohistidine phosphatase